jgi:hypothetical protein
MNLSEQIKKTRSNVESWKTIVEHELTGDLEQAKRELKYYQSVLEVLEKQEKDQ